MTTTAKRGSLARIAKRQDLIWDEVLSERERQDDLWGEQNHAPVVWLSILMEEVGEAAQASNDSKGRDYREEMVQVAAVAVAMIESWDRNKEKERKHGQQ